VSVITIRPTAKFVKAGTAAAAIVFIGLETTYLILWPAHPYRWVMVIPPLILLWPLARWVRRQSIKAVLGEDRLRFETGITARSTRNIQLAKVQDVRVDQSVTGRIFRVGSVSVETAGEASRLTLVNVDDPQALADEIMNRAGKAPQAGSPGGEGLH
jgi:uncharacterized membrane protein YdbT with pleckstrin-like domain